MSTWNVLSSWLHYVFENFMLMLGDVKMRRRRPKDHIKLKIVRKALFKKVSVYEGLELRGRSSFLRGEVCNTPINSGINISRDKSFIVIIMGCYQKKS